MSNDGSLSPSPRPQIGGEAEARFVPPPGLVGFLLAVAGAVLAWLVVDLAWRTQVPSLSGALAVLTLGALGTTAYLYRLSRRGKHAVAEKTLTSLRDSEKRLRALIELSSDWYWETDHDFRFTYFSEGAYRAMSKRADDAIGKRRWECPTIEVSGGGWEAHRADLEARRAFRDLIIKCPDEDGKHRWLSMNGTPMYGHDGSFTGYCGIGRDVTARIRTAEALKESETRFREFTALSSDWYWEQDEEYRFTLISDNCYRILKTPPGTALGLRRWEVSAFDVPEQTWEEHKAILAQHLPYSNFIARIRDSEGKSRVVSFCGSPIFCSSGVFRGYRGTAKDITAQASAEQALRRSEGRFRILTELCSDWYWEQDENLRFSYFSADAYQFGEGSIAQSMRKTRWELPYIGMTEQAWAAHRAILELRLPFRDLVLRRRMDDGIVHTISSSGTPIFEDDGAFRGYQGVTRDITEQVNASAVILQSERRFRRLAEGISQGFWFAEDSPLHLVYVSPAFERTWSAPAARLYADRSARLQRVHPADRQRLQTRFEEWLRDPAQERCDLEYRLVDPSGEIRWIHDRGTRSRTTADGNCEFSGIAEDITARKNAELVLRESEEKFRLLAENMRDIFWIYAPHLQRFDYVSASYERIWGQPREAIYADPQAFHQLVVPEDIPLLNELYDKQRRGEPLELELRIRRPDGERRSVLVRSTLLTNSKGEKLVCGITEDITERKLEEQRRLEDSLRQRDALVREVHHRIKNTLQGVTGLLRRHARRASASSCTMDMAITQVQSVAIVHGLQAKRSLGGVALCEMLEAVTRMQEGLSDRPIRLESNLLNLGPILLADGEAVAVALVLNEVVSNAVKHIAAEPSDDAVQVQIGHSQECTQVRVRNRGRLPVGFDHASGQLTGTGLGLVRTLAPREGMRMAFTQDGDFVDVSIELSAPVVLSGAQAASSSGG